MGNTDSSYDVMLYKTTMGAVGWLTEQRILMYSGSTR